MNVEVLIYIISIILNIMLIGIKLREKKEFLDETKHAGIQSQFILFCAYLVVVFFPVVNTVFTCGYTLAYIVKRYINDILEIISFQKFTNKKD